ncbi:MAG: carboxypeptidase-like regulatory domain-containing protein [Bacteroidota bacterium]
MTLLGQEKTIYGKILNSRDIEGIHILNRSSRFNTVTNAQGEFRIKAQPLDTLIISSVAYVPEQLVITTEIYNEGYVGIRLETLVTELDEVLLGPRLSGNLEWDIKNIEIKDTINFDDVGIPGFTGEPEEKIAPVVPVIPLSVDLEALYKHLSGYYRKLRIKRKWEAQNVLVVKMINYYTPQFYEESYGIPEERLYDFLLFCIETSDIEDHFNKEHYNLVLETFASHGKEYTLRMSEKKE